MLREALAISVWGICWKTACRLASRIQHENPSCKKGAASQHRGQHILYTSVLGLEWACSRHDKLRALAAAQILPDQWNKEEQPPAGQPCLWLTCCSRPHLYICRLPHALQTSMKHNSGPVLTATVVHSSLPSEVLYLHTQQRLKPPWLASRPNACEASAA